jgi:hypothetical protein
MLCVSLLLDRMAVSGPDAQQRVRGVEVRPFPASRRLVTGAVRAGRRIVPMHGLFDVDITTARRLLADHATPLSLTAFVVRVGRPGGRRRHGQRRGYGKVRAQPGPGAVGAADGGDGDELATGQHDADRSGDALRVLSPRSERA